VKSTTPTAINENVLRLKAKLGLDTEPVFVFVRDTEGHKVADCFYNVRRKIEKDGGSIQYGWNVWELPGYIIEGEFHAVWVNHNGEYVDITPKPDGETQILFIPDPNRRYQNVPVDNVRVLLTDEPAFVQSIQRQEKLSRLRIKYNVNGVEARIPTKELEALGILTASKPWTNRKIGRNERCPCGSGKKFKFCHGR
jgi:hypothetical protein